MTPANAQEGEPRAWSFSLAVGTGKMGTLLREQSGTRFNVLPRFSYYGERFYIENLDLGYNLIETKHWSWDLTTQQSFDALLVKETGLKDAMLSGVFNSDINIGLPWDYDPSRFFTPSVRHLSYLGGTTLYWRNGPYQVSTAYHKDISNVHQGSVWQTKARYVYQQDDISVAVTGEMRYLDNKYSDYYFGVNRNETRSIFELLPGANWLPALKIEASLRLTESTRLVASAKREWLPSAYEQSLLLGDRQYTQYFAGVAFSW